MRRFLLISVFLHGIAALLLQHTGAYRHAIPPPGRTLALTLLNFSEPARSSPQARPAPPQKTIQEQQAVASAAGQSDTPVQKRIENAGMKDAALAGNTQQAAREGIENMPGENTTVAEDNAQPAEDYHDSQDTMNSLRAAIYSALQARFTYPRRARLHGWEGTVVVSLHIMSDGQLSDIQVVDSSGIAVLDRAALRSLSQISLPQVVAWLNGHEIDMLIPVEYRLTDS
ncbi:MAG: energy transducer TonB [Gammaproteobacteria bacterium]